MAKIKFGMMMTDARGKLGGHVFSKNRSGAYIRTKVTPSNGRTSRQSLIRAILGALSQSWSALTAAQRASWNGAVNDWATTDIFGDARNPSGKTLYTKLNLNALNAGLPEILTAPAKLEMPITGLESAQFTLSNGRLTLLLSTDFSSGAAVVNATPVLSQGTTFVKGLFRQIITQVGSPALSDATFDAYVAKFGVPSIGDNIHVEVIQVLENGQASVRQSVKATVVA